MPDVTQPNCLSTSLAWLMAQAGGAAADIGVEADSPAGVDPALVLWRKWIAAFGEAERLCRRQQRLERLLIESVGFPYIDVTVPGEARTARVSTPDEVDGLHGDRPDFAVPRSEAQAALAEQRRAWDDLDAQLGYSHAKIAETDAFATQEEAADVLWSVPACSVAGTVAKLHAILLIGDGDGSSDEFPWPQICAVMTDLIGIGNDDLRA
ncbi:hypothetical protein [Ciceribacter sp. RN22]|uniref:hypothetical protein n=1 Tax=Ciceribacter sp. RN22 TaxID=2954932 RepID=UPI002092E1D1|nr:hypothetical protein [Ciceribacter sp. RN22]MCO6180900.1 hypothetical protein [Ciceribacter sp. RN22]